MSLKPNQKGEKTLHQPIGSFLRNVSVDKQPPYESERGPEDDVHEEGDGVDDDEPFNSRLHLHQFDPDGRDSDAGGDSDDSERLERAMRRRMGVSEFVGLGSGVSRARSVW